MNEREMNERSVALLQAIRTRPEGPYDFLGLDSICKLMGWDPDTAAAAIRVAACRGWVRSFGHETVPLGCSLLQAGLENSPPAEERGVGLRASIHPPLGGGRMGLSIAPTRFLEAPRTRA